jgi:hypothetical protein
MKTKNLNRKEQPIEFDKKLAEDLLGVLFNLDLAEQKLISIGMQREDYFADADKLWNIIFEQTIGVGPKAEMQQDKLTEAWSYFERRFESREEFDPTEFIAWLSAGKLNRHPFERERKRIWTFVGGSV